jgi:predicted transcriptional regulator
METTDEEIQARLQEIADHTNRSLERVRADTPREGQLESIRY